MGIYVLFLASIFLHGLLIWSDLFQRGLALLVSVLVLGMTFAMRRSFAKRLIVELREEDGRTHFSVIETGHPATADVQLSYPDGEQHSRATAGAVPNLTSLRQATFQPDNSEAAELKVWAHKATPEGDSEGIAGTLRVRQGDETKEFDLKLTKGQVVVPMTPETSQVDIVPTESRDPRPRNSS